MVAPPKNKQRCGLSVMVQYFCEVDYAYELPSSVFVPRPKVDAAVVHLRPRADLYAAAGTLGALGGAGSAFVDFHTLEYTVRACFNGRRKMMRTNIRRLFAEPEDAVQALTLAGIQPESRPTVRAEHRRQLANCAPARDARNGWSRTRRPAAARVLPRRARPPHLFASPSPRVLCPAPAPTPTPTGPHHHAVGGPRAARRSNVARSPGRVAVGEKELRVTAGSTCLAGQVSLRSKTYYGRL